MTLGELKSLLAAHPEKQLSLLLPTKNPVPVSFHVTEVGLVSKRFIDCGGAVHSKQTCQIQAWVGSDQDHRLSAGKLSGILKLSRAVVPNDDLDVEIEYEDCVVSQFMLESASVTDGKLVFQLGDKHTDCLAKEACGIEAAGTAKAGSGCCGGSTSCC